MKKIAVITGVSQGMGRAMIDIFIEKGWYVVGCARREAMISDLNKKYAGMADFTAVDIASPAAVKLWADSTVEKHGRPSLILNNASLINESKNLADVPVDEFRGVMDVNVNGVFYVIKSFVNSMPKFDGGNGDCIIVNMSSGWGRNGAEKVAPYCASKFAIEGLTQSYAKECPNGMAVVSLDPGGGIATPMLQSCWPEGMNSSPTAEQWASANVPYIIENIKMEDNGKALTCPPVQPQDRHQATSKH